MVLNRSKTFFKYLLSYLTILLVGVFVLGLFFETYLTGRIKESIIDNHREILRQSAQGLDGDLRQIDAIDYQLTCVNDNFLSVYLMEDSPVRDLKIVQEFSRMLAPLTFVSDIAMYKPAGSYVYTSSAAYVKEVFFSGIYHFDEWQNVQQDLLNAKKRFVRPVQTVNGAERYAIFVNTPSLFSRLDDSLLLFFVRESQLTSRFEPYGSVKRQGAAVAGDGTLIFSTIPLDADVLTGDGKTCILDGVPYLLLKEKSEVMDWSYYSILPLADVMLPLYRLRATAYLLMGVTTLMGILLISYFMHVNYTPLKELSRALGTPAKGDELQSLGDAISLLSTQNENMRRQLMEGPDGRALKDALLFSLLKGKFSSFEDFNKEGAALGVRLDKPLYQVLLMRHFSDDADASPPYQQVQEALQKSFGCEYAWQFRELFEPSMLVCLVGMDNGAESGIADCCRECLRVLSEEYDLSFTIGASGCYDDIKSITKACFEATQSVREHFIRGREQFIPYQDANPSLIITDDPLRELANLDKQTPQESMESMRRFVTSLKAGRIPSLLARSYCNYAVQLLARSQSANVDYASLFSVNYLRTADDFLAFMLRIIEDGMPKPQSERDDTEDMPELMARIKQYIAENYDDCNFSIQDAADRLNLNSSYMSQYFHQQTGDTLNGYVSALRMKKACLMLETTAMPLQMVAESVGYYNLNSFIRRFKQVQGVTPGEYRRLH